MEVLLEELKILDVFFFKTKLNKQISIFVIFDYRKKCTVEELFTTISHYYYDLYYRGINSPLDIINIKKYGIDCPNRSFAHFAIESYSKSLEYGKSEVGQVICGYSRDNFTDLIIPEEGNDFSEIHPYKLIYNGENYFSAVEQDDFHPGYDLVYGRAIKDVKTIAPKVVVYLAKNDEQLNWFQSAINASGIYVV